MRRLLCPAFSFAAWKTVGVKLALATWQQGDTWLYSKGAQGALRITSASASLVTITSRFLAAIDADSRPQRGYMMVSGVHLQPHRNWCHLQALGTPNIGGC